MAFVDSLPQGRNRDELAARDAVIVKAVSEGKAQFDWFALQMTDTKSTLRVYVMADALKIEGVRMNVSATAEQQIADLLGCVLLTPKLADLTYRSATVKLAPQTFTHNAAELAAMAFTSTMVKHSAAVDAALAGRTGLVADVGKDWVLVNKLATGTKELPAGTVAANYGWHIKSGGEASVDGQGRVIQGVGLRHDRSHVDYSQVCRLARINAELDAQPIDLRAVMQDSKLAHFVSHEGPLAVVRQPGVSGTPELVSPPKKDGAIGVAALALLVGFL